MWPFSRAPVVPVVRFTGVIGMATPLRPGLTIGAVAGGLEKAFQASRLPDVAVIVNSPGGSPVQSSLIYKRIRQLAAEHKKTVHVFCEDVAASGGYYLAAAGDKIYADASSIVGSIGVITAGFGFDKAIERLGIDRRVYTAGDAKGTLDAFSPEKPEDVARLKSIQRDIHESFIGVVKESRAGRLTAADDELFTGAFWAAPKALELGLIDGIADLRTKMRELHGDKVKLKLISFGGGGLLSWLRRGPALSPFGGAATDGLAFPDNLVSAIEARLLWSRFGL